MGERESEWELVRRAGAGDADALAELLWRHYDRLEWHIARRIAQSVPASLRPVIGPDDVVQEALVEAWRHIGQFEPRGQGSFYAWLKRIAERRLQDAVRAQRRMKRGGGAVRVSGGPADSDSSVASLLEVLVGGEETPSKSVARRELEQAVRVSLAGLKEEHRKVLELRYLAGLPVAATAEQMGRSRGAVQMLCQRALAKLRRALGRASKYLSGG